MADEGEVKALDALRGLGFDFAYIPAGTYPYGMQREDLPDWMKTIYITLSRGYHIARTPVTQSQWVRLMGGGQYASNDVMRRAEKDGFRHVVWSEDRPAVCLTRDEALAYCRVLSQTVGGSVRLPTDVEWETACRGGTDTSWFWGDRFDMELAAQFAWFNQPAASARLERVGQLKANPIGLLDMCGLVNERVMDLVSIGDDMMPLPDQYVSGMTDPCPGAGTHEMSRGGSLKSSIFTLMSSSKVCHQRGIANGEIGFRIALESTKSP